VTLAKWISLHGRPLDGNRSNAWKCLYLNRTSFSGILMKHAGPLGGKSQTSENKIDCRFYRDTVIQRLRNLWAVRDQVEEVAAADWETTVDFYKNRNLTNSDTCLLYFDPPFFHKAERLYNYRFHEEQHEAVVRTLSSLNLPWLLSYDHCTEAIALFQKYGLEYEQVPVQYTSSKKSERDTKMELVSSNLPLPKGVTD
jgi:DNA adenine methylase